MVFCFVQNFFFGQHKSKVQICFPEFNIRLYDKTSELDFFFPSTKIRIFFFSNIWNQNIFLEKKYNPPPPPFKINGRSLICMADGRT